MTGRNLMRGSIHPSLTGSLVAEISPDEWFALLDGIDEQMDGESRLVGDEPEKLKRLVALCASCFGVPASDDYIDQDDIRVTLDALARTPISAIGEAMRLCPFPIHDLVMVQLLRRIELVLASPGDIKKAAVQARDALVQTRGGRRRPLYRDFIGVRLINYWKSIGREVKISSTKVDGEERNSDLVMVAQLVFKVLECRETDPSAIAKLLRSIVADDCK